MADSIEDRIVAAVQAALDPYIKRLADPEPLVYTVPQAAKLLQTSTNSIRRLLDEGYLPIVPHMGTRVLIPREALHVFVKGRP